MSPSVLVRALLLNPVILGGIFLLLVPLVGWRVHRFLVRGAGVGVTLDLAPRLVGMLVAISLLAGLLAAIAGHWGIPLGDLFRLRALERTAIATQRPPGTRLLSERSHVSTYIGIDEYTAGEKDAPDTSSYTRVYRAEADLAPVMSRFERIATGSGWKLVGTSCDPGRTGVSPSRIRNARRYERDISGFRATLNLASLTVPSTVFPGTAISDVEIRLNAPSILADAPNPAQDINPECLAAPASMPRPPAPAGACAAANRKLDVVVPEAALALDALPLRVSNRPADLRRMRVRASDDAILASSPPSEPRPLLEKHAAIEGWQAYTRTSAKGRQPGHREATYAYEFPSHEAATAFHREVVARACPQAMEAFDLPGVADAVGLRLYVPATGPECDDRWDLQWGLAFGSGAGCGDWLIEYVAFVRGQYHVSVAVGVQEWEPIAPWEPPDLASIHVAALQVAGAAATRACQVRAGSAAALCR